MGQPAGRMRHASLGMRCAMGRTRQPAEQMRQAALEMRHAAGRMSQAAMGTRHAVGRLMSGGPAETPNLARTPQLPSGMLREETEQAPLSGPPARIPAAGIPVSGDMSPRSERLAAVSGRIGHG